VAILFCVGSLFLGAACFACIHSQRELIDRFCKNAPVTLESGERIRTAKELQEYLERICPEEKVPSEASISKHKRWHIYADNVKALITKDGMLMTPDGRSIPHASADEFLQAQITLAYRRLLENPELISISQANEAIALLLKIRGGLAQEGEVKEAWLAYLQGRKKTRKKPTIIEGEAEVVG
jgi:hypothetical protein